MNSEANKEGGITLAQKQTKIKKGKIFFQGKKLLFTSVTKRKDIALSQLRKDLKNVENVCF